MHRVPLNKLHPCIRRVFTDTWPVPEKGVSGTEYLLRTGKACFLHRMPPMMRRVPQEPVLRTARIFRTVGGPLRYRILRMPEKRRALSALNASSDRKEKGIAQNMPGMPPRARKSQPPRPTNSKALHNLPVTTAVNHPASTSCHQSHNLPCHHSTPKLHHSQLPAQKKKSRLNVTSIGTSEKRQLPTLPPGGAVPSALVSLTSLFGMGRGGSSPL